MNALKNRRFPENKYLCIDIILNFAWLKKMNYELVL